jgi:ABC-type branched-subunit amino acid transport system substrate-binding protein
MKYARPAPDVIYLSAYGSAYGAVVRQLRELNVDARLTADVTMGLPDTIEQVGDAAEGVYFVDGKVSPQFSEKFIAVRHEVLKALLRLIIFATHPTEVRRRERRNIFGSTRRPGLN